jgi:hypothetical protein
MAEIFHQNSPAANPGLYPLSGILYNNQADLLMLAHTWTINPRALNSLRIVLGNIGVLHGVP